MLPPPVVALIGVFAYAPIHAQTGPTGTWRVEGVGSPFPWEAVLRAYGSNLIGAVSTTSIDTPVEISDGRIDGNTITFKFNRGPYDRRIRALTGKINGDEIVFTWQVADLDGNPPPRDDRLFGATAPRQFIAKRVADAKDRVANVASRARKPPAVTFDRILRADREPHNWLTYSRTILGQRYSPLTQIAPNNIGRLELAWIWQAQSPFKFEATPLVVDGVLYTVQPPNDLVALDASTGRELWIYRYTPQRFHVRNNRTNRGLAILGGTLFMGTLDAHLLAVDAYSGRLIWDTSVADSADPACNEQECYSITLAPLVVKDKVIVGTAGGEGLIRGLIAAFDAKTGKEAWRFSTIPAPGEQGNETWSGDSWKTGGASVWNTGSYDPDLNLVYWGTGNPSPTGRPETRLGDNLYSDSVVALDADTGKLVWYYQFTPHDDVDWDATQIPVLADVVWQGRMRKVMLWGNRNGLFYVLDRATGQFLLGKPFVEVNWTSGFNDKGRPVRMARGSGTPIKPGEAEAGATNWFPPSYSPSTGLFYIPAWESTSNKRPGEIRALNPQTGEMRWEFKKELAAFESGVMTTASNLLFTGLAGVPTLNGMFCALDARTGDLLWHRTLPQEVTGGPISYSVDGKQYVAIVTRNTLFAFALRE